MELFFNILFAALMPLYPISALLLLKKFINLEKQLEEIKFIAMIAEEQSIKTERQLDELTAEHKRKVQKAYFKGVFDKKGERK